MRMISLLPCFFLALVFTLDVGAAPKERCSDGKDNDGDGLVDADDPDCGGGGGPTLEDRVAELEALVGVLSQDIVQASSQIDNNATRINAGEAILNDHEARITVLEANAGPGGDVVYPDDVNLFKFEQLTCVDCNVDLYTEYRYAIPAGFTASAPTDLLNPAFSIGRGSCTFDFMFSSDLGSTSIADSECVAIINNTLDFSTLNAIWGGTNGRIGISNNNGNEGGVLDLRTNGFSTRVSMVNDEGLSVTDVQILSNTLRLSRPTPGTEPDGPCKEASNEIGQLGTNLEYFGQVGVYASDYLDIGEGNPVFLNGATGQIYTCPNHTPGTYDIELTLLDGRGGRVDGIPLRVIVETEYVDGGLVVFTSE